MSEPEPAATPSRTPALAQIDIGPGRIDDNPATLQRTALAHRAVDLGPLPELVLQGQLFAPDREAALDLLREHPAAPRTLAPTMHGVALDTDVCILYGEVDENDGTPPVFIDPYR